MYVLHKTHNVEHYINVHYDVDLLLSDETSGRTKP